MRQLTDGDGDVTLAQGYTPFGVLLWSEGSGASGYGFTGEQQDPSAGLVFLRARYYDPATGQFISKDTHPGVATMPATLHPYLYSLNNPINLTDPSGEILPAVALVLAVAAGGFIVDWADQVSYNMYVRGMSFWDAVHHKNIDEARMLNACGTAGTLAALAVELPALALAGGGALLMQTGIWTGSPTVFSRGLDWQTIAAEWSAYWQGIPIVNNRFGGSRHLLDAPKFRPSDFEPLERFASEAPALQAERGLESFGDTWTGWGELALERESIANNFFVCRSGDVVVGAMKVSDVENALEIVHIEALGGGAGTTLMQAAIRESIARGYSGRLLLEAAPQAVPFYEKLGAVFVDARFNEYLITEEAAQKILQMKP